MLPYIAEFLGTMMLIILGDGVVANVTLNKSGMKGAGSIQITFAWGLAVMVPAFIFGAASGAHFNPALTIALAIDGSLAWGLVPGYLITQFAGAFVGACIVYLLFKDQFDATEAAGTKLGVFYRPVCSQYASEHFKRSSGNLHPGIRHQGDRPGGWLCTGS